MSRHIVSVGDLVLDVILPVRLPVQPAAHQEAPLRRVEPGGAGNFMIAARRMGLIVSAAGAVGADTFGTLILDALTAEGIDVSCVVREPGSTSTLVIVLTDQQSGEHTFIGNYGQGPDVAYPPALDEIIARADALFVQGYTLSEHRVVSMSRRAIERARQVGVPVLLDAGPFMAYVAPDLRDWAVAQAAVILATEEEIPLVAGGQNGPEAWQAVLAAGPQLLVIKRGAAGCTLVTAEGAEDVPGFPAPVTDTVGAGDCFDAAFVAGLLHGLSRRQCARLANAMGAAVVQRVGAGRNAPPCAEVLALLEQAGERIDYPC
ncbi:MAG: sugar kinase [Anaerolineae bacterium]|nr:MAG: sugar kinase [Anaerolineae bacterium]